jgi:D-glycero-alpha-D-manno-heptose-7-phosphate kinase
VKGRVYFRAKAPLRISFCGGGTDVSPYPEERGGCVLSVTVDKYAWATLAPRRDSRFIIRSLDYSMVAKYPTIRRLAFDGELDLAKAVARRFRPPSGADLFLHSDAPPGSGLGSSSTMTVALVGAFKDWMRRPLTEYEIAELTYGIERVDLELAGGRQDQYAATFGGFNFIEFTKDATVVNPLRVSAGIASELEYNLVLCYTGLIRASAHIVERQTRSYVERRTRVVRALDRMKEMTIEMKSHLLRGRLREFGGALHEAWLEKKKLDERITNPKIDELYHLGRKAGAIGGKILGAGGGGYLLLYCPFPSRHKVATKLEEAGGQVVKFSFQREGLVTWTGSAGR